MYIEYTTDRLILASFGILIMLFFIICYPFARTHSGLRSFYNKISLTRVIIGICLLTYLVVFKYLLVFFDAAIKNFDQLLNNEAVASLFLGLDITDVICLAMILCLFFDRGNNFIRYLAPISFIIGFYTLVFNVLCAFSPDQLSMVKFNAQYFFLGYDGANVAYLTCIFNLALGLWYTMDEKVVIWKTLLINALVLFVYYLYVLAMSSLLQIDTNVSGLSDGDFTIFGKYYFFNVVICALANNIFSYIYGFLLLVAYMFVTMFLVLAINYSLQFFPAYAHEFEDTVIEWERLTKHRFEPIKIVPPPHYRSEIDLASARILKDEMEEIKRGD